MFKKLILKRFGKFRDYELEFPSNTRVVGLVGPNGAGKSTIVEAIGTALYGLTQYRGRRSDLDPNFEIVLTGAVGFPFVLQRGGSGVKLTVNGQEVNGALEVKRFVEKNFLPENLFESAVFARQEDVTLIAALKPKQRLQFLLDVLGLSSLMEVISSLRSRVSGEKVDEGELKKLEEELKGLCEYTKLSVTDLYNIQQLQVLTSQVGDKTVSEDRVQNLNKELSKLRERFSILDHSSKIIKSENVCPICCRRLRKKGTLVQEIEDRKRELVSKIKLVEAEYVKDAEVYEKLKKVEELRKTTPSKYFCCDINEIIRKRDRAISVRTMIDDLQKKLERTKESSQWLVIASLFETFCKYLVNKYFKTINCVMQEFLHSCSRFRNFELKTDGEFLIDNRPFTTFSGGEKSLMASLLRLVITQVVCEQRLGETPIAIFDSSFDSLDEVNCIQLLHSIKSCSSIQQIIVTSHSDSFLSKSRIRVIYV